MKKLIIISSVIVSVVFGFFFIHNGKPQEAGAIFRELHKEAVTKEVRKLGASSGNCPETVNKSFNTEIFAPKIFTLPDGTVKYITISSRTFYTNDEGLEDGVQVFADIKDTDLQSLLQGGDITPFYESLIPLSIVKTKNRVCEMEAKKATTPTIKDFKDVDTIHPDSTKVEQKLDELENPK